MRHHSPALAACFLLLLASAACSSSPAHEDQHPHASKCRAPGKAVVPHTFGTLTEADNGARICIAPGAEIAVFLHAHDGDARRRWQPVTPRPGENVAQAGSGVMTLPVGVTAALFIPTAPGEFHLSSRQSTTGVTWQATLVAR